MPKKYNIASWFTPDYERKMERTLALILKAFPAEWETVPIPDIRIDTNDKIEDRDIEPFFRSADAPVWSGLRRNVPPHVISIRNNDVFRRVIGSYLRNSIVVFDKGESEAERGELPLLLAERFLPPRACHGTILEAFPELGWLSAIQLTAIAHTLELVGDRGDAAGRASEKALDRLWRKHL